MTRYFLMMIWLSGAAFSQPRPEPADYTDIALPSQSADGGDLAVRLLYRGTARTLFSNGAPVVIEVPGGFQAGGLSPILGPGFDGFVYVRFLFPGGRADGRTSAGTYDTRGAQSVAALRDVALFASGEKADREGRRITDLLPFRVRTDNVGLLGLSFGGNVSTAVMAMFGDHLPSVKYFVGWENPSNAQISTAEPGPGNIETCPGGQRPPINSGIVNPFLRGYGPVALDIDYARLAWDSASSRLYFDGNQNGQLDTATRANGCQSTDRNNDGSIGQDEDFPIGGILAPHDNKRYYSTQILEAASARRLIGNWPAALATLEESKEFWSKREAVQFYDALPGKAPGVMVMLLASERDHVQTAPGHHHIRQAFEGFHRNGIWVKINPEPASFAELDARLRDREDLPENAPNVAPESWLVPAYAYPENVPDAVAQAAACRELARRTGL